MGFSCKCKPGVQNPTPLTISSMVSKAFCLGHRVFILESGIIKFCQENALVIANNLFQRCKRQLYTIRLIIFFGVKDGEALYSQQKQNLELTVAQVMNSLSAKFRLKLEKVGKTPR